MSYDATGRFEIIGTRADGRGDDSLGSFDDPVRAAFALESCGKARFWSSVWMIDHNAPPVIHLNAVHRIRQEPGSNGRAPVPLLSGPRA